MRIIIYICLNITIVYLGYITGKEKPEIRYVEKLIVKKIKKEAYPDTKPIIKIVTPVKNTTAKPEPTNINKINPSVSEDFSKIPSGRDKYLIADENIDQFLNNNPDILTDDQADLYAQQIKFIFDWSKPDPDQTKEWVQKLSKIKSAEFKTDIFEYMVQARLIDVKELEDIVIKH